MLWEDNNPQANLFLTRNKETIKVLIQMWSCPTCTLENAPLDIYCLACGSESKILNPPLSLLNSSDELGPQIINLISDDNSRDIIMHVITDTSIVPMEVNVNSGMSLEVITARALEACDCWNVMAATLDILIDQNEDTWAHVESVESLVSPCIVKIVVEEYHAFDNVHVDSIGYRVPTRNALIEHNSTTMESITSRFPYARKIRGDGNCFYRAVCFRLIETLAERLEDAVLNEDQDHLHEGMGREFEIASKNLDDFCTFLTDLTCLSKSEKEVIKHLFHNVQAHACGVAAKRTTGLYVSGQMRDSLTLDRLLIKATRHIIGAYLIETAEAETLAASAAAISDSSEMKIGTVGGSSSSSSSSSSCPSLSSSATSIVTKTIATSQISIADIVSANFEGQSVQQFVHSVVLPDTRDAEDIIVAFAGRAFKANVYVWQTEKESELRCLAGDDGASHENGEVHLVLYSGHYDLLYKDPEKEIVPVSLNEQFLHVPAIPRLTETNGGRYTLETPASIQLRVHTLGEKRAIEGMTQMQTGALVKPTVSSVDKEQRQGQVSQVRMPLTIAEAPTVAVVHSRPVKKRAVGALAAIDSYLPTYNNEE